MAEAGRAVKSTGTADGRYAQAGKPVPRRRAASLDCLSRRHSRRGFALVAAIGVLALLMVFAISALGSAQFTLGFSRARAADQRLGSALEEGAALLSARGNELFRGGGGSTSSPLTLLSPQPGGRDDVTVSATLARETPAAKPGAGVLTPREGDLLVQLEAGRTGDRARRRGLYLINTAGQRRAPILLRESRL